MRRSRCRSCDAPIIWTVTEKGKKMPVDAGPIDGGDFDLADGDPPTAVFVGSPHGSYSSHFATCDHADSWRKKDRPVVQCPKCGHKFVTPKEKK